MNQTRTILRGYDGVVVAVRPNADGVETHAKHPAYWMTACLHFPMQGDQTLHVVRTDRVSCQWCIDRIESKSWPLDGSVPGA